MNMKNFEIIDGVYSGPEAWDGDLDLRDYKDTLTSLGSLTEVRGGLVLKGCTSLVSLGSLKEVGGWTYLEDCTSLISLGSLTKVEGSLYLTGCTNIVSTGVLKEVLGWLDLEGCTSLTSLGGSLTKVGSCLWLGGKKIPLQEVQEKISYYSSLPLHEVMNALHMYEVQSVPLYKNILLQTLQGG
jgi:hypothetical protein